MAACMVAAAMRIAHSDHFSISVLGCCLSVLPIRDHAVSGGAVAAGPGTKQGQALIVGVRCLNFLAVADAAGSGFRLSEGRDQGGYEYGGQNGSQGFIL